MKSPQPASVESSYPRVYRNSLGWTVFALLFCAGMATLMIVIPWPQKRGDQMAFAVAFGGLLLFGAYVALNGLRSRVLLFPDRIEVRYAMIARTLGRHEILGWRALHGGGFALMPRDSNSPTLKIAQTIKRDEAFYAWMDNLPWLDEIDQEREEKKLADDPSLGGTPEERSATLTQ